MSFTVYKSSAGSGKTYTLVKEYIIIALKKPDQFKQILAITFTNKAASEMKERIIHYLRELSADTPDVNSAAFKFLLPDIVKETNISEDEIFAKSRQVLNSILHNYSDFAICTIDSFAHRIIRSFAHDLKVPLNFEVEMDIEKVISEAIDILISKAGTEELLTKVLVEFLEAKTDDEKSWHIENDLKIFSKQLFKEDNFEHLERIRNLNINDFLEIRKKILKLISFFENEISKIAKEAKELIEQNSISIESFYHGNSGVGKYFENLANGNIDKINPNSYVIASIEHDKWYTAKTADDHKAKIDNIKARLINIYNDIENIKEKHYKNYILYKMIFYNIYPIAVLNEIEKIIEEIKIENNILPISEFNRMISNVVVSQPVPFIYERIGEKYQNYMVDEFQDTSSLQWLNMLPLIENSLSYNHFNMIVGDGKQAIYRFRGGDVEQFALLPELTAEIADDFSEERAAALSRNYIEKKLSSNYRSKAEIIDFNNKFFNHIFENASQYIKSIYNKCVQEFNPNNTGGYINIDFVNKNNSENDDDVSLNKIIEIIQELVEQNYLYSDIAILCRANYNASIIAKHLLTNGINVISEESLLIAGSENVNFLLALASFISNNDNEIAKYRILYYLFTKNLIIEKDIHSLSNKLKKDNTEFDKTIHTNIFLKYLNENKFNLNLNILSSKTVFELFEELISIFNLNCLNDVYIRFFLDAVLEFLFTNENGISAFIEWWEEKKDKKSIIAPAGINAVKIMTIHKSKGLEFPVVIYPFANEKLRNTKEALWVNTEIPEIPELKSSLVANNNKLSETAFAQLYDSEKDKSLLDLLNVLYVVMTRPSERLYVLSKMPEKDFTKAESIPDLFVSYLKSINKWEAGISQYNFGSKTIRNQNDENKINNNGVKLNSYNIRPQSQTILLKTKANEIWDSENPNRNSEWGNIIHHALSKIVNSENVESTIEELHLNGIITLKQTNELKKNILEIISNPLLNKYFNKDCVLKTEAEILLKDGSVLRPDRVVIEGNKAIVIDYKTGGIKKNHEDQIHRYALILEEMGYAETEKILVYTDLKKIICVP